MNYFLQLAKNPTIDERLQGPYDLPFVLLILFITCFPMLSYYLYNIWKIRRWENKVLPKKAIEKEKYLSVVYMCTSVILMQLDLRDADIKKSKMLLTISKITPDYTEITEKFGDIWKKQVRISHLSKWMNLRLNREERANVIYFLIEISYTDGVLLAKEFKVIEELGVSIGLTPKELRQMIASHKQRLYRENAGRQKTARESQKKNSKKSQRNRAFEILGVSRHAGQEEIKKAYRTLVKKFHPDRYIGKSPKEIELAESRFIEIQKAYDLINETS